jgi:hypothetical protein
MNFFSASFKVFALVALLSVLKVHAMEKDVPAAPEVNTVNSGATIPLNPQVGNSDSKVPTTPPTNTPVALVRNANAEPQKEINNEANKEVGLKGGISSTWGSFTKAIGGQKDKIFNGIKDMRERGWSKWSTKERFGVAFGGTVAVIAAAVVGYKIYEYFTTPAKTKVKRAARA